MSMPRTVQEILDHADELAKRFEDYEPSPTDERDPAVFSELRRAVLSRSDAERSIRDAVKHARERGYSWAFISSLVGTSGEAARQRYGHKQDAQARWVSLGQDQSEARRSLSLISRGRRGTLAGVPLHGAGGQVFRNRTGYGHV
jgi:hypothetical protein